MLRLGRFYREEKDNEKSSNLLFDGKELIGDNQQECFQSKKWFNEMEYHRMWTSRNYHTQVQLKHLH